MRYKITGRNINVTPGLKAAVEEKIGKLERYFNQDTEVNITLTVEKDRQKIEVTIPVKGTIIRAEQESNDMYVSIDLVEEIIERQLKKYKNKIVDKKQAAVAFSDLFINEEYDSNDEVDIVKVKKFAMKPMDPEEACVQMEPPPSESTRLMSLRNASNPSTHMRLSTPTRHSTCRIPRRNLIFPSMTT